MQIRSFPVQYHKKMKRKAITNDRPVREEYIEAVENYLGIDKSAVEK